MVGKKQLDREVAWLKREKYGVKTSSKGKEVVSCVTRSDFACLERDIRRLKSGEPFDYVIGRREFLGCQIDLSARPLIPRAETEFWVEQVIKNEELGKFCEVASGYARNDFSKLPRATAKEVVLCGTKSDFASPLKILDLFSGSGCIGLAVLKHCPTVQMTFGEKDPELCKQIKKNLKLNGLKGRVIQTNVLEAYRSSTSISHSKLGIKYPKNPYFAISNLVTLQKSGKLDRFDIIFANPPYVSTNRSRVQKSVKNWESREALFAGADGLAIIKKFLKQAKNHLNPACPEPGRRSKIYLEFGYGQKNSIEKLLKKYGYSNWQFHQDQFGKYRWVMIELKK